jgi:hypothetical protein
MIEEVTKEGVIVTAKLVLALPPGGSVGETFVSALLRRAAAIHCPCSPATLASAVRDSLHYLVDEGEALDEMIDICLEGLLVGGDLLELSQVSVDDPNVKGTWVFAAPPAFVMRPSGAAFLMGISADEVSPLPPQLAARIEYRSFTRTLPPELSSAVPLRVLLGETGMLELPERVWLRAPTEEAAASFRDRVFDRLAGRGASGTIDDLEILDSATGVMYYKKRWSKPKRQTGIFVGRRPRTYGSPIWCVVRLIDGEPVQILDLPLQDKQAVRWRGCDAAWHLQMAIDQCNRTPQKYRSRAVAGGAVLDFFSPLPLWARRRLMNFGRPEPRHKSFFSYFVWQHELAAEEEFLQRRLWLAPELEIS